MYRHRRPVPLALALALALLVVLAGRPGTAAPVTPAQAGTGDGTDPGTVSVEQAAGPN